MTAQQEKAIALRPPAEIREWLKREAQANERSIPAQIVWTLKQFIASQEQREGAAQ